MPASMSDRPPRKRSKSTEILAAAAGTNADDHSRPPADTTPPVAAVPEKPSSKRARLGAVSLEVPDGWRFFPLEDRVVGRPDSNVGVLVIKILPSSVVPDGASHEMFMGAARAAYGDGIEGTGFDPARERIGCCYAGGESFRTPNDFVRIWYHHRPEGLVAASFSAPAKRMVEKAVKQLIGQCDKIIASIRLPSQPDA
jgi:hypothetical protein